MTPHPVISVTLNGKKYVALKGGVNPLFSHNSSSNEIENANSIL